MSSSIKRLPKISKWWNEQNEEAEKGKNIPSSIHCLADRLECLLLAPNRLPQITCKKVGGPWKFCCDLSMGWKVISLCSRDRHSSWIPLHPLGEIIRTCREGGVGNFKPFKISTFSLGQGSCKKEQEHKFLRMSMNMKTN